MIKRTANPPCRWASGLSLVEATISIILVGLTIVAALNTLGAAKLGRMRNSDRRDAHHLAQALMMEIMRQSYEEPEDPPNPGLGREAGESDGDRDRWDDVDDYAGWSASPPEDDDNTAIPGHNGWTRSADVQWVVANDLATTSPTETGVKRITVKVKHGDETSASLVAIRTSGLPSLEGCCFGDGTCQDLAVSDCQAAGGTAQGPDTQCSTCNCLPQWIATGSYVGDGTDDRPITGVGFAPDVVIIKADAGSQTAVIRTSTMIGDAAKSLAISAFPAPDVIQSFDADGFTVGNTNVVNMNGEDYDWVAFKALPGVMQVGTYVGDGIDDHSVAGVGLQPQYVLVCGENDNRPWQRFASMPADMSVPFGQDAPAANRIQAFEADGFQVGTTAGVNEAGVVFHYACWATGTGNVHVDSYGGDGIDNRNVTGTGFEPKYVLIKADTTTPGAHRTEAIGPVDETLNFNGSSHFSNGIQTLDPDGFQVGTHANVNQPGAIYYWTAFGGDG